jgi:hypothetical protein
MSVIFKNLKKKRFNAAYEDGAIYVINVQDNAKDMADDIVHEIAHSVEERHSNHIYGDGRLQREFLGKRERLYQILKANNENSQEYKNLFHDLDYDAKFDDYLVNQVGYKKLGNYINGLFYSPYAATSVENISPEVSKHISYLKIINTLQILAPYCIISLKL